LAQQLLVSVIGEGLVQIERASAGLLRAARTLEGVALGALGAAELARLTDRCYEGTRETLREDLFEWEETWLRHDLPEAPAHILVGGCGHGREVRWLRRNGYRTTAFEPVPRGDLPDVVQARYEDLLAPSHAATQAIRSAGPYAAVLLGWGSFAHVPGVRQREAVLCTLRQWSDGPLLLSYLARSSHGAAPASRARDVGVALGRWLRRGAERCAEPGDLVLPHCGYVHAFTTEELQSLAKQAGYAAECFANDYPHATLRPVTV
jgi:hypothetical protein